MARVLFETLDIKQIALFCFVLFFMIINLLRCFEKRRKIFYNFKIFRLYFNNNTFTVFISISKFKYCKYYRNKKIDYIIALKLSQNIELPYFQVIVLHKFFGGVFLIFLIYKFLKTYFIAHNCKKF